MAPATRELDERFDGRGNRDDLRLDRPPSAHRDDDDLAIRGKEPREVAGHRGLADALARACDGDRRHAERCTLGRIEAEVRAQVRDAPREHAARELEPLGGAEDGLVGEIDHHLRPVHVDRRIDVDGERDAVVLSPA